MEVDIPGMEVGNMTTTAESGALTATAAQLGNIGVADGSACYEYEGCKIMAAVWGPLPVKAKSERPEGCTLMVTVEPFGCPPSLLHNSLAVRLQSLLELSILEASYPRSLIHVAIQPVRLPSPSEKDLPFVACFNAAILALMNAAIPMASVPVAVREGSLEAVYMHRTRGIELLHFSSSGNINLTDLQPQLAHLEGCSKTEFARIQDLFHQFLTSS